MDELRELFQQMLNQDLIQIVLSNTRDASRAEKVKIRPVMIRGVLLFQETLYRGGQVFHSNHPREEMRERLADYMEGLFRQAQIGAAFEDATVLVGRRGSVSIRRRAAKNPEERAAGPRELSHDRSRRYILEEGNPVDFLVGLGVQTPKGRVVKAKYDKFRQINRFLEFIEDIVDKLPSDRTIRIVDFGCGKSYLTFAIYYYLHHIRQKEIRVTGLDLKADVIDRCRELAEKLHYDGLEFIQGDIGSYDGTQTADMVVSLHACDTATDYALEKAVKWGASVIMAVPCCQHELNLQMDCDMLRPLFRYGVIKERVAALATDALRADLLEQCGYSAQILEFIDMEHTPKNLMIRAVKTRRMRPGGGAAGSDKESVDRVMGFLHVRPTLKELL